MNKTPGSPLGALSRHSRTLTGSSPALPLQAYPTVTPSLPAPGRPFSSLLQGYLGTQKQAFQQNHPTSEGLLNASHSWGPRTTSYVASSVICPKLPTIWAHFWEMLSIIFREAQFPELGRSPQASPHKGLCTRVAPRGTALASQGRSREALRQKRPPLSKDEGRVSEPDSGFSARLLVLNLHRPDSRALVNFPQLYNLFRYFQQLLSLL